MSLPKQDTKLAVCFLLASPYSGATLLSMLLDRHSQVVCHGETFPFQRDHDVTCTCGALQIDCEHFRAIAKHMIGEDGRWNAQLFRQTPTFSKIRWIEKMLTCCWSYDVYHAVRQGLLRIGGLKQKVARFVDAHESLMRHSLRIAKATVYVDGTKDFMRSEIFTRSHRFQSRFLFLVRDPRAFCNSYLKNLNLPSAQLSAAIRAWRQGIHDAETLVRRFPQVPNLWLRYEDLCSHTDSSLDSIWNFLQLDSECVFQQDSTTRHLLGNRMRMNFSGEIKHDLSWQLELDSTQINQITLQLERYFERFNYIDS